MDTLTIQKEIDDYIVFFEKVESGWHIWFETEGSLYECIEEFNQLKPNGIKQVSYLIKNFDMDLKKIDDDRYSLTIDYIMGDCDIIILLDDRMKKLENENKELKEKIEVYKKENLELKTKNNWLKERDLKRTINFAALKDKNIELEEKINNLGSELKKYTRRPGKYNMVVRGSICENINSTLLLTPEEVYDSGLNNYNSVDLKLPQMGENGTLGKIEYIISILNKVSEVYKSNIIKIAIELKVRTPTFRTNNRMVDELIITLTIEKSETSLISEFTSLQNNLFPEIMVVQCKYLDFVSDPRGGSHKKNQKDIIFYKKVSA